MTITVHTQVYQGTPEWLQLRCGILTASELHKIITPSNLKPANNDKVRQHLYELLAQRITNYVDPGFQSFDMMRGQADEVEARAVYSKHYAEVSEVGFISNDKWGFTLGYSPDGLVFADGLIECKSRAPKYQIETIMADEVPSDYMVQIQSAMLISERAWVDFISYCGGLPMFTKRVYPNPEMQAAIVSAAASFYDRLDDMTIEFAEKLKAGTQQLIKTERKEYGDIIA